MKLNNQTILIISPEFWGINRISKHHYALELSKRNNTVYFLNPPSNNLDNNVISLDKVSKNLHIVTYPLYLRGLNLLPNFVRKYFHCKQASQLLKSINVIIDIVWSFDPFRFQNLNVFQANLNIYHAVDVHNTNVERDITKNADVILATSDKILDRFAAINKPKFKINHGLAEHFLEYNGVHKNGENENLNGIKNIDKIKVGYVGNLFYKYLDVKVFKAIIRENEHVIFYFIGPYEKSNLIDYERNINFIKFLKDSKNVHLLGSKPSNELPSYINQFDLLLLCYTGDRNVAEMANPHKILEYLSTGKAVVSHYVDEYKDKRDLISMVNTNHELLSKFKEVVKDIEFYNSPKKSEARISYALQNTYLKQLKRIENLLIRHTKK
jgi:hypothetical protein